MKQRFFWIVIALISINFTLNAVYAQSKRLSEPIFLEHYIEVVADQYPKFYYITNNDDPTTISYVEINGATFHVTQDTNFFDLSDSGPSVLNEQTYNHYALRSFQLSTDSFYLEDVFVDGKFSFDEISIYFNDGTYLTTPIGQVIINEEDYNSELLSPYATTSSSDTGLTYSYRAEKDMEINDISMTFKESFQDDLIIMLNTDQKVQNRDSDEFRGEDFKNIEFPISVKEGEFIQLHTDIRSDVIGVIEFPIYISGVTKDGEEFTSYAWLNNQQLYLEKEELKQVIEGKGRGGFK